MKETYAKKYISINSLKKGEKKPEIPPQPPKTATKHENARDPAKRFAKKTPTIATSGKRAKERADAEVVSKKPSKKKPPSKTNPRTLNWNKHV